MQITAASKVLRDRGHGSGPSAGVPACKKHSARPRHAAAAAGSAITDSHVLLLLLLLLLLGGAASLTPQNTDPTPVMRHVGRGQAMASS